MGIGGHQRELGSTFHLGHAQLHQRRLQLGCGVGGLDGGTGGGHHRYQPGRCGADGIGQRNSQAVARDVRRLAHICRGNGVAHQLGCAIDRDGHRQGVAHDKRPLHGNLQGIGRRVQARIQGAHGHRRGDGAGLHGQGRDLGGRGHTGTGQGSQARRGQVDGIHQSQGNAVACADRVTADICGHDGVAHQRAIERERQHIAGSQGPQQHQFLAAGDSRHLQIGAGRAQGKHF